MMFSINDIVKEPIQMVTMILSISKNFLGYKCFFETEDVLIEYIIELRTFIVTVKNSYRT